MNVTILTSAHQWNDPRIFARQARSLAKAGHSVRLLAPGAPACKVDSVTVSGPLRPKKRWRRMSLTLWRLAQSGVRRADVVHVHDPELLIVVAALKPLLRHTAWVYDAHEDYSEQLQAKPWIPKLLRRPLGLALASCERRVANRCDLVVAATQRIARRFDHQRTIIVENYPDVGSLPPPAHAAKSGTFTVLHLGEMNERRGASILMEALAALQPDSAVLVQQIGRVKPANLLDAAPSRLRVAPQTDHRDALKQLAVANAALLLYQPGHNHDFSQPNKLFEYLAAGVPVLTSDIAHWRSLVERCGGCAVFVDPSDPEAVRNGFLELEKLLGEQDRVLRAQQARATYSWESQAAVLVAAYEVLQTRLNLHLR